MTGGIDWAARLRALGVGTRVVLRYRIAAESTPFSDTGARFTDVLGDLLSVDDTTCTIDARRGPVAVAVAAIVAAKAIPPPPPRR